MNDILKVKNLYKTFNGAKEPSLFDISLNLKKGEKAALIGPDGSGKPTFLRILSGILFPDNIKNDPVLINSLSP